MFTAVCLCRKRQDTVRPEAYMRLSEHVRASQSSKDKHTAPHVVERHTVKYLPASVMREGEVGTFDPFLRFCLSCRCSQALRCEVFVAASFTGMLRTWQRNTRLSLKTDGRILPTKSVPSGLSVACHGNASVESLHRLFRKNSICRRGPPSC